ncbi:uncharacterized protein LOC103721820 isoform X2 [Phoenix dactylifera]|uniref:Uncharacterized protein LOC103721820 isoform X2 n=1 Tax=Phoenix dactylifera TaxID=42345 RepID=A0A8B7D0F6_PHODC|nr:uncharacterized protein LOC103721820 isoform X2 [Phoenix dactylifera]
MDAVLLESPTVAKPPAFAPLAGLNFQSVLKESIDRFLIEVQKESCDFSAFRSIFFRLIQSSADPPLEVIWLYSAVGYHEAIASKKDAIERVMAVKDLLQLLFACSASCGGLKSIALLAPAVSELYRCVTEAEKLSKKVAKKARREIEALVEGIISYISICSSKSSKVEEFSDSYLLPCFVDLVRVWTVQHSCGLDGLGVLFPLVSDEIRGQFRKEGCGTGYLAGVVVTEAFLLRLCLKIKAAGAPRSDLQKELRIWAVSSITTFQNRVFFEILLRLLLDPPMPVSFLLCSMDESLVRDILYDAVILVDYSFINPGFEVERSDDSIMNLLMTRLIVTHEAIQVARSRGDQGKAIAYINAFSTSIIPNGLVNWVTKRVGLERLNRPTATTPQALLKWFLGLEEQGLRLFEDNILKLHSKLIFDETKFGSDASVFNMDSKKTDADLFFFDNRGEVAKEAAEDEDMETMDTAFLAAARSMKSTPSNGTKKRKEWGDEEGEEQMKFVKHKLDNSSVKEDFAPSVVHDMSSGSEVENPASDDDMEDTD